MKMLTLLGIFIFSISALAMNGRTTYQAKIIKPDGYPLEASSVNFRFSILDYSGSCVIYVEDYTAVNMGGTGGLISFALGAGTRSFPASGTAAVFQNAFDNSVASFPCQSPGIYNPLPQDGRKIVMQFHDGNGWQTLPAMTINAVPYAMYAAKSVDSKTLNGKADTAFVENSTLAALNCNPATHAITFNGVSFSCIAVGASGGGGITSVTTSGTVLLTGGTASAPVISIQAATMSQDGYLTSLDYAEFKAKLSASSTEIINTLGYTPVSSSTVASQIASSTLAGDVSGNPGSNTVDSVGGKPASQVSTSVDDTLAATSSATADTIVKRNSLGNFTANDIYANAAKINYVDIYKPLTSFSIRLQAPTSLSTNYVLNLPTTSGTTGQVLSTDGTGNLSWISPTTGSVVSVSATAPLASTGGSNPTISITQSSSSTDGYLSSSDWTTFNNKQQATSSAIIATLGYTPADNAASGTYAQKANNLSDLTNIPQARTNLGLGTLATGNSIDLGSASATGIIADARLQTQSNVTSGTQYTKVTVDGKGRVTSGAQLSSNDVTSALGYTPADNAASGTYLVKASNLSDLANVIQARSNLGLGGFATISSLDLGSASATGTLDVARLPSFNGDATIAAASNTIVLSNSGVSAGTYSKVTVDAKGRVTSSSALSSSDITTALGYTPATSTTLAASFVQKTGDTMTGTLNLVAGTTTNAPLKLTSGTLLSSAQSGTIEYDGSQLYFTDGFNARRAIATNSSQGSFDNTSSISNSSGNITLSPNNITGSVIVNSSAASISSGTGALVVNGGVGIAGSINAAGNLNLTGSATIGQSLSLSSMTSGSLLFAGASGLVSEDNSRLFWDGANKRLGLGTNSPAQTLSVSGTSYFSGNVGIGTQTPMQKLDVHGYMRSVSGAGGSTDDGGRLIFGLSYTGTSTYDMGHVGGYTYFAGNDGSGAGVAGGLVFSTKQTTGATSATERMRIDQNGNVGIGTTEPATSLHIFSTQPASAAHPNRAGLILESEGTSVGGRLALKVSSDTENPLFVGYRARGTASSPTALVSGDIITSIAPVGYDGAGGWQTGAHIRFNTTENWSAGGIGSSISFRTPANSSTSVVERMKIDHNGNVGIGTKNPAAKLEITEENNTNYERGLISAQYNNGAQAPLIITKKARGTIDTPAAVLNGDYIFGLQAEAYTSGASFSLTKNILLARTAEDWTNAAQGYSLHFFTGAISSTATTEKMTITPSGNVGIGVSAPTVKLQVGITDNNSVIFGGNDGVNSNFRFLTKYTDGYNYIQAGVGASDTAAKLKFSRTFGSLNLADIRFLADYASFSGNLGVGTNSPQDLLHVASGTGHTYLTLESPINKEAQIKFKQNNTDLWHFGMNTSGSRLDFWDVSSTTTRMSILNTGNVGVGTVAPRQKFDVAPTSGNAVVRATTVDGSAALQLYKNTGGAYQGHAITTSGNALYFNYDSVENSGSTLMTLSASGNLGIGVAATEKLDVIGNMRIGGNSSSNYIAFRGTTGDGDGSYNHTYIGERVHASTESSELLLFKGNDSDNASGPDRIRMAAGNIVFDTYASPDAPSGTFEAVASSPMITTKMIIKGNGNVGIGTSAPGYTLDVSGTLRVKGTAYTDGGYTTWTAASDIRLKDIHGNYNRGLDDILDLNIIRFQYKSDNPVGLDSSKEFVGVTAQNLQQGIPEAVTEETNGKLKGYLTINTTPVLWTLVNAVKQLYKQVMERFEGQDRQIASIVESKADKAEIEDLRKDNVVLKQKAAEVDTLKAKSDKLEAENAALKSYLCSKDPAAPICK